MTTRTNRSAPINKVGSYHMNILKCKNCGAPITHGADKCEYCGVSFILEKSPRISIDRAVRDAKNDAKYGIMTPNEARQALGLESIRDDVRGFHEEMKYIREGPNVCGVYDGFDNSIKTIVI